MSNEQMKRIFDQSACLTPRQLKGYVSGSLVHEEAHAVEAHIMGCPFCSEAIDGIKAHRVDRSVDAMEALTPDFLDGHSGFSVKSEVAAATSSIKVAKKSTVKTTGSGGVDNKSFGSPQLLRTVSIAATVLIAAGVFWFIQSNRDNTTATVADNVTASDVQPVAPQPVNDMVDAGTSDSALVADNAAAELPVVPDSVMQQANGVVASADDANTRFKEVAEAAPLKKKDSVKKVATTVAMTTTQSVKKVPMTRDAVDRGRMGNSYTPENASNVSIGGARGSGTAYNVDGVQINAAPPKAVLDQTAKDAATAPAKPLTADELYDQKKYTQALAKYKQEMQSSTGKDKEDAKLGIAKCYIGMGDNKQAVSILRGMLYDNSKRKKQAKKLLRSIGESDEE